MSRLSNIAATAVLWFVLFLICLGLGYPTLARYDSRITGNTDAAEYYSLVVSDTLKPPVSASQEEPRPRILVPLIAKAIHRLVDGRTRSADAVFLGLLFANSFFTATAALILVHLGTSGGADRAVALFGATLYLLSFAVPNYLLSGLVDSSEACLILVLAWAMTTNRWWLLPVAGVLGAVAKETFVPFALVFTLVWWLVAARRDGPCWSHLRWIVAMNVTAMATFVVLWSSWQEALVLPWSVAQDRRAAAGLLAGLRHVLFSHEILYVFAWLGVLGVWNLRRLAAPWVAASFITAGIALGFGAWHDAAGNTSRALFNLVGPVLSLSTAMLIAEKTAPRGRVASR